MVNGRWGGGGLKDRFYTSIKKKSKVPYQQIFTKKLI